MKSHESDKQLCNALAMGRVHEAYNYVLLWILNIDGLAIIIDGHDKLFVLLT